MDLQEKIIIVTENLARLDPVLLEGLLEVYVLWKQEHEPDQFEALVNKYGVRGMHIDSNLIAHKSRWVNTEKDGCLTCSRNKPGREAIEWCRANCLSGSEYKK